MNKKDVRGASGMALHQVACPGPDSIGGIAMKLAAASGSENTPNILKPFQIIHHAMVDVAEVALTHQMPYLAMNPELTHELSHHGIEAAGFIGLAYSVYSWAPRINNALLDMGEKTYNAITNIYNR